MFRHAVLVVVVGCSNGKQTPSAGSGSGSAGSDTVAIADAAAVVAPPSGEPSCEERAVAFGKALDAPKPPASSIVTRVVIPTVAKSRELTAEGLAVLITKGSDIYSVDGRAVEEDKLEQFLEAAVRGTKASEVDIVADETEAASRVITVAKAVAVPARLLVRRDGKAKPPYADVQIPKGAGAWFAPWLDEMKTLSDPGKRQQHLAAGIEQATGTECKQIPEAFAKISSSNPVEADEVMRTAFPIALDACGCKGVDPAFETIVLLSRSSGPPSIGWLPIDRKATPDRATKTVGDLARMLSKAEP